MNSISLHELAQGAINEQFQMNLQKVIDNIYDPNTAAKATRKLTITMTFKPDATDREMVSLSADTKLSLAPAAAIETKLLLGYDTKNNKTMASEWGSQMKGQLSIEDEIPENVVNINKKAN